MSISEEEARKQILVLLHGSYERVSKSRNEMRKIASDWQHVCSEEGEITLSLDDINKILEV